DTLVNAMVQELLAPLTDETRLSAVANDVAVKCLSRQETRSVIRCSIQLSCGRPSESRLICGGGRKRQIKRRDSKNLRPLSRSESISSRRAMELTSRTLPPPDSTRLHRYAKHLRAGIGQTGIFPRQVVKHKLASVHSQKQRNRRRT